MGSIGCEDFYLIDTLPGYPDPLAPLPSGGFDATQGGAHAATAAPAYRPGLKIQCYQDHTVGAGGTLKANKGYYTMIYGKYHDFTQGDCSATCVCTLGEGSTGERGSGIAFTKDMSSGADSTICGPAAIPCTSVASGEWAWFWCDGICPNYDLSRLDCTGFLTDGGVVGGGPLTTYLSAEVTIQNGFSWPGNADGTASIMIVGYAFTDDT